MVSEQRQLVDPAAVAAIVAGNHGDPFAVQINRLKTLKRAMYGRKGVELLRAPVAPPMIHMHGK
jgi:hypothetical protein